MKDILLYEQILGLAAPWRVDEVKLKHKEQEIEVCVSYADTILGCPECQQRMVIHDYEERRRRHLDSCQFKCHRSIQEGPPRVEIGPFWRLQNPPPGVFDLILQHDCS